MWPYGIEKSGYSPKEFFDKLESLGFEMSIIKDKKMLAIDNEFKLLTKYQQLLKEDFFNQVLGGFFFLSDNEYLINMLI